MTVHCARLDVKKKFLICCLLFISQRVPLYFNAHEWASFICIPYSLEETFFPYKQKLTILQRDTLRKFFRDFNVYFQCHNCCPCMSMFVLDATDLITDGFYDPGQLRDKDCMKTVEEYGNKAVDDRRPVIVVNPRPALVTLFY